MLYNSLLYDMDEHFPEPKKFIPERWLREDNTAEFSAIKNKKVHPFVYLPFGHGPRQCIGMLFAKLEVETLVARVCKSCVQKFLTSSVVLIMK
jgi:cytochrome P450 family 12